MLKDSILFPAVLWRDSMKDSSREKTVVRADIKTKRLRDHLKIQMEFSELCLCLEDEWWNSNCPHVQHSLSNPDIIKMLMNDVGAWETRGPDYQKTTVKADSVGQVPGGESTCLGGWSATILNECRVVQFQGLGKDLKLRRNCILLSRK